MRCLAEFLSNSYVQTIIAACRESRAVQGILVEVHPVWLRAWRIGESFNPTDPAQGYKEAAREGVYARSRYLAYPLELNLLRPWLPFRALTAADLKWRPQTWGEWDRRNTYSLWPVVMRICLYPSYGPERGAPPEFKGDGFRIIYEVRPIARLYSSPKDQHRPLLGGVSVGVDSTYAGTMGGILKDAKGRYFGLTCAHVTGSAKNVEQPAQIDRRGNVFGHVVLTQLPPPFPSHAPKVKAVQQQYAAKVDAALVAIDPGGTPPKLEVLKMGKVTDLVALDDIGQDEELQLTGRTSDWQLVQRSSVSPFYNLANMMTGDEYCYENALIFREPSGAVPAQPGDSGAWLCKEVGTDYHWAAMVVGGDRQLGVAVAAHELKTWWEAAGYQLSVR